MPMPEPTPLHLILSPSLWETPLTLSREGDLLHFNDVAVDLSLGETCLWMPDPAVLSPDGWQATVILPHGPTAPEASRWPTPIDVTADGPIALPPYQVETLDTAIVLADLGMGIAPEPMEAEG